jgi:hypothetical protein
MPELQNRQERVRALLDHPLSFRVLTSKRSPTSDGVGDAASCSDNYNISICEGWVKIIERIYAQLSSEPEARIRQIKEKFGTLRCYVSGASRETMRAIAIAEAESARTCLVCGCRGYLRNVSGWWMTLCDGHATYHARHGRAIALLPGYDSPKATWFVAPSRSKSIGRVVLECCDPHSLTTWTHSDDHPVILGFVEPDSTLIATDLLAVLEVLEVAPCNMSLATEALSTKAHQSGKDDDEFAHRLAIAQEKTASAANHAFAEVENLAIVWRWLEGHPEIQIDDTEPL